MAPIAKESEVQNSSSSANAANSTQTRVQPVALEIAVTVNGARSVDGTNKREPFSETTQTVLVFGNGAVIRLSSSVAPGQLLFLTNEKTKKEVVCQVVKSKNYRSVSGYVELEFTESAIGFWGMRFPSDRIGTGPAAPSATPAAVVPAKPAPVATSNEASTVLSAPASLSTAKPAIPAAPVAPSAVVPPPSPVIPVPVNVTPASTAPANVAPPAPSVDNASEELKKQAARLQEQLSSMLFSETLVQTQPAPVPDVPPEVISEASTKILEMTKVEPLPAPPTRTFEPLNLAPITPKPVASLHEEEVKIPSWLEPLARNAAAPAQPVALQSAPQPVISQPSPSPLADDLDAQVAGESYDFGSKPEAAAAPVENAEVQVPNFGSDLFANSEVAAAEPSEGGSKKGIWIGAIAATILLAVGGGYWYMQQSGHASASTTTAAVSQPIAQPASPSQTQFQSFAPASSSQSTKSYSAPAPSQTNAQPLNSAGASMTPATEVEKIPASRESSKTPVTSAPARASEPVEDTRKANFSGIRLAAPTVKGGSSQNISNPSEPGLALENNSATTGGPVGEGLVGSNGNQPAVPVPIGGEVKPAVLISSVPPSYPSLARTQRISGDVKIDALIDEQGRVTGMKVVSGPVMLHQAAQDALRQWKYRPASLNGAAVPMHLLVTIQFRMQ